MSFFTTNNVPAISINFISIGKFYFKKTSSTIEVEKRISYKMLMHDRRMFLKINAHQVSTKSRSGSSSISTGDTSEIKKAISAPFGS